MDFVLDFRARLKRVKQLPPFGYVAAIAADAVVTTVIDRIVGRLPMANVSMLYLIGVLATAVAFGSGPAVLASFAAFFAFDWFFVEPFYSVVVADPVALTSLVGFLLTAIVTGQLAASQRRQAREAREREREAIVLYDLVRLMRDPNLDRALRAVAHRLRQELGLAAVAIEVPDDGDAGTEPSGGPPAPRRWADPVPATGEADAPGPGGRCRVPVAAPGGRNGALILAREPGGPPLRASDDRLLSAVASQLGIALERSQLRRQATDAEILPDRRAAEGAAQRRVARPAHAARVDHRGRRQPCRSRRGLAPPGRAPVRTRHRSGSAAAESHRQPPAGPLPDPVGRPGPPDELVRSAGPRGRRPRSPAPGESGARGDGRSRPAPGPPRLHRDRPGPHQPPGKRRAIRAPARRWRSASDGATAASRSRSPTAGRGSRRRRWPTCSNRTTGWPSAATTAAPGWAWRSRADSSRRTGGRSGPRIGREAARASSSPSP